MDDFEQDDHEDAAFSGLFDPDEDYPYTLDAIDDSDPAIGFPDDDEDF